MAAKRPGPQTFGWSGNSGPRERRVGRGSLKEEAKLHTRGNTRKEGEPSHQPTRAIPQPTMSSRLPQAQTYRRLSGGAPEQQHLGQRAQIRTSIGSSSGLGARESNGPPSSASASSRLPGPSLKPRNVLRRKRSGLSQDAGSTRSDSRNGSTGAGSSDSHTRTQTPQDAASTALHFDRELTQSPMEIRVARQVEIPLTRAQTVTIYPELDRYRDVKPPVRADSADSNVPYPLATHDLPPPTPLFSGTSSQISAFSGSPSTRWSESPGPGPYSRDTTPTSISSQSPGLMAPLRIPPPGSRIRQADPALTRPPVTRRRAGSISNDLASVSADPQGLAAVRESSISSSSNSTVRAGGSTKERKGSKRPPSPPPRKSSQNVNESRDGEAESPAKPSREPAQPQVTSAKAISYSRPRSAQAVQAAASPKPPVRPSRKGTADLPLQFGQSIPVVQSNLSTTSLSSERRQSGLLAPAPAMRSMSSSSLPDRPGCPSRRPPAREPTPAPQPAGSGSVTTGTSKQEPSRPTRTPSPSVSTSFKTRFPLFGRRTKTVPEPSRQQEKKEKPARKGPAAGTGHEGYGRLGSVRRRSSTMANTGRAIPGTMSSQESLSSSHSYDAFLRERMAPVIIAGGEVVENRNTSSELTRTESNQSSTFRRPSTESRNSSQVSLRSRAEVPRKTLWPSPLPRGATQAPTLGGRRPSESSDSEAPGARPTLALRRSMQRLKSRDQERPGLPKPIVTRAQVTSPSITSLDASILSDDSIIFDPPAAAPAVATKEPVAVTARSGPKKLMRRARSPRRWNFFGRSQNQPAAEKKTDTTKTVAATVQVVQSKPVAFYTMMDSSEPDDSEPIDLEEVLREAREVADVSDHPSAEDSQLKEPTPDASAPAKTTGLPQNGNQPSTTTTRNFRAPLGAVASSIPEIKSTVTTQASQSGSQPPPPSRTAGRPSRLPQVGRIPKVVNARAEGISPKSFSRPFHRLSVQMPAVRTDLRDEASVAKRPSPPRSSTPEPAHEDSTSNISALIHGVPRLSPPVVCQPGQEFLSFSPRKDSQCTTTTTSSSSGGRLTFADAIAIVPDPNAPLSEDEIWDEYNDLLGDDTIKLSTPEGPSRPKPLILGPSEQGKGQFIEHALESPTLSPPPLPSLVETLRAGMEHPSLSFRRSDVADEVKRMLGSEPTPADSTTINPEPPAKPNDQSSSVDVGKQSGKPEGAQRDSACSGHQQRRSDASGSSQGSEGSSPMSQVNLRVGSMTVSKWLTFGHVLFSPVRDELLPVAGSLKRPSILVVDGLGNDDWSFYAAETYPAATFFNLSPRAPLPAESRTESSFPLSPPNHHQVQYLSHTDKFPFGAQSFTAVVFRFPAAAPEGHYRNIISEARRVLKPGGYIELSILDVDLNNMGNRCRRTIRRLKERIHAESPDTSLGSTSDLILRLIGRRGFTDIKTCRVGVPVASNIAQSSGSETPIGGKEGGSSTGMPSNGEKKPKSSKRDERSLPEMINDEGPVADESIAKSVARIGRWWYSRCYETAAAPGPRSSIWNDKALLAECQAWGTSLKLMVCHARAPDGRGRVASI